MRKYKVIGSIKELSVDERMLHRIASIGLGSFVLLTVVCLFLLFGTFPSPFFRILWVLVAVAPFGAFAFGYAFGSHLMLLYLGYIVAPGVDSSSQTSFPTYDSSSNFSQSYHSSVSINPSSGQPMSGSSGIDISGNPYGSRSW